jgi:uncharacterized protein (UPF0332 family)
LTRSRLDLEAARFLAEGGFFAQAVSRAYYAAFYAAEHALPALGESRSKHSGVAAAFERLVVREGGAEPEAGRLLRSLFRRRNEADYRAAPATQKEADEATRDAERVVDAVESWLTERKN